MCDSLTAQSLCLLTAAPSISTCLQDRHIFWTHQDVLPSVLSSSIVPSPHFSGEKKNSLANKRPGELALLSLHSIAHVSPFSSLIYLSSMLTHTYNTHA